MDSLEISAKTVEEATKKALTRLNAGLDEIEVTVLSEGKGGILGIGAEDARIRVQLKKAPKGDKEILAETAVDVLENILHKMDIQAQVTVENGLPLEENAEDGNPVTINITSDDSGMLIGRHGQTLDALQYLVRLITSRRSEAQGSLMIDVEKYRQRRHDDLKTLALNVARQVKSTKSSFKMEPMSPFERRIIHLTLANDPDIHTESIGEGEGRKVTIFFNGKR